MHPRHRSPGNGYRSGSMGMNMAVASRISPESSVRSHGFHNSEYRSLNRGFGRSLSHGHPKSFQPPPPPLPRKSDIFMEAGRLAAEYLVSQGFLPASALSGKWQNGNLKKQVSEFQEFRSPEGENLQVHGEMRTSALARLGNSAYDSGSGRRRYSDDYNAVGMRNHVKGRRRGGSFRGYGSDWGRDYVRNGSWSDRRRVSPEMGVEHAADAGHNEEKMVAKDNADAAEKTSTSSAVPKSKDGGDSDSEVKEHLSKANSGSPVKDRFDGAGGELSKESRDLRNSTERNEEIKDGSNNQEAGKKIVVEKPAETAAVEIKLSGSSVPDLRALCKFANVPTRIRSSRGTKLEPVSSGAESNDAAGPSRGTRVLVEDDTIVGSSNAGSANDSNESKCLDSEISKATSLQPSEALKELPPVRGAELAEHVSSEPLPEVRELSPACGFDEAKGSKSESFPDRSLVFENDRDSSQGLPGCKTSNPVVEKRVEKWAAEESNVNEGRKRTRDWLSPIDNEGNEYFHPSKSSKSNADVKGNLMSAEEVVTVADPDNSASNPQLLEVEDTTCAKYSQEKQLFPSSFKICDLNLIQTSDVNENHDQDPIFMYPPISDLKAENSSVDVDLSISNAGTSSENARHMPNDRAIEVIDLESDSALEDKAFNMPERKTEAAFTGLEGFANPAPNAVDIPDAQDGYGLMISELLGNDFANCTTVQGEINALDNIGLHNGEVPLEEDDPIYMSLGEIPFLSFFRNWENAPPQEDGKPF
ncbi:uncharacterized protein At4g26450 isoform X1 [Syzygium oleosum]|uniref:uncharacterized protein At4g26450 isoform X1 n=1 Tax=Syzygium oleosum TaxID=219896 RepID=UPI0011D29E0E|nr:uncharacterized protein At4g26450 isoform X1 [Syzygium oleosum]